MPESISQTRECDSIVMPDRLLEGEQASETRLAVAWER